jgi:hypothetical protein
MIIPSNAINQAVLNLELHNGEMEHSYCALRLNSEYSENRLYIVFGRLFGYFFPQKSDKK